MFGKEARKQANKKQTKSVPGVTIATDIICGFPGETEEDFMETLNLVQQYKFPVLYISQFYPRPGTVAARMERVSTQEVKRRSREITKAFESYRTYDHELGTVQEVNITEINSEGQYVAHNKAYEQVLLSREGYQIFPLFTLFVQLLHEIFFALCSSLEKTI